jgi:glutaredoxin
VSDPVARLLIAVGIIASALLLAAILNRYRRPVHPTVTVGEVGDRPGVVLFTSTDCSTCKRVIERLKQLGIAFREVTYELESGRFEAWGVVAVPLTVFVDADSEASTVYTGVPSRRNLRRAATSVDLPAGA